MLSAEAMVDDLEDLFSTPRISDDSLSTEGVEELFERVEDKPVDDGIAQPACPTDEPSGDDQMLRPRSAAPDGSIHDLLSSLSEDLKKLAGDIHKLLED